MQRKRRGWVYPADWMPNTNFSRIFKVIFSQHIGSSSTIQNTTFHFSLSLYCSKYIIRIHQKPHNQLSWPHLNNSPHDSKNRLRTLTIICTKFPDGLNKVQKLDGYLHHKIFFLTYKNDLSKIPKILPDGFSKSFVLKEPILSAISNQYWKMPEFRTEVAQISLEILLVGSCKAGCLKCAQRGLKLVGQNFDPDFRCWQRSGGSGQTCAEHRIL